MKSKILSQFFFIFPRKRDFHSSTLGVVLFQHLFYFLFYIFSCSTQPYVVETTPQTSDSSQIAIYIVNHGWHTGIILPAGSIFDQVPELQTRFKDADYLEFGWGDKGFYQADEITFNLTVQALFWPTESVVHVVGLTQDIHSYFSNTQMLCVSEGELAALCQFLSGSFAHDINGNIIHEANGIYGNGQFYKGNGHYHLFNTCNKWTAKGLKSTGFDISPSVKLTAESIVRFVATEQDDSTACH